MKEYFLPKQSLTCHPGDSPTNATKGIWHLGQYPSTMLFWGVILLSTTAESTWLPDNWWLKVESSSFNSLQLLEESSLLRFSFPPLFFMIVWELSVFVFCETCKRHRRWGLVKLLAVRFDFGLLRGKFVGFSFLRTDCPRFLSSCFKDFSSQISPSSTSPSMPYKGDILCILQRIICAELKPSKSLRVHHI